MKKEEPLAASPAPLLIRAGTDLMDPTKRFAMKGRIPGGYRGITANMDPNA